MKYLGVDADDFAAFLAAIGENALVALDAVRMLVPENVALPCQGFVALPATEVAAVPVLVHRLCVFATENQLQRECQAFRIRGMLMESHISHCSHRVSNHSYSQSSLHLNQTLYNNC